MNFNQELFCKIYVDTDQSIDVFLRMISEHLQETNIEKNIDKINNLYLEIYMDDNDDFDEENKNDSLDGFLHFRYYLDVSPTNNTNREAYIASIANLLNYLWLQKIPAVAACDFENQLPNNGGYQSTVTPWA